MNFFFKEFKNLFIFFLKKKPSTVVIKNESDTNILGFVIYGNSDLVRVGQNVSFGGNICIFANASVEIGDHTMISVNVVFHTSTHDYHQHPMWLQRIDRPIKVGKHVWIGVGAIISPGVIIGDYAVVGAGSVVVSNVPSKSIVAGNPARVISYRNIVDDFLNRQVNDYPIGASVIKGHYLDNDNICKLKN